MKRTHFVAIKNQSSDSTLELYFLDVIQDTYDWWTGMQISKVQEIIDKVNAYKPNKIVCYIDSVGGDAQTGMSIYNFLKLYNAKIEVRVIGLAASIAAIIAMAANKGKLFIARNGFMMIHKAEGIVVGTSDEIRQGADLVDKYDEQIADILSQRTGKSIDEINALMANGDYWMTGQEAKEQGFADDTFNEVENVNVAARLDPAEFDKVPARIRAQMKPADGDDHKTFIQNQFEDMKKFFSDIVNAIRGVKPEDGKNITNQIADAVSAPFEKIGEEIETTITNKVTEAVKGEDVKTEITAQVNAAADFSKEGPAKTALDASVKVAVENATKDYATKITNLETANTELKKKNEDLEKDITNLKGKKSVTNETTDEVKPIGKWNS
ncbi:MAG: head maturation protease, ClpP-related [Flavisolibacter sp.]|jgi:ATP-dependent Clp protease protease subunit